MGILPYGYKPNHRDNLNKATNNIISKFPKDNPLIHYVNVGHVYYDAEGRIRPELMPDYLHPNAEGHMLMFKTLENKIAQLMAE
jgi:beta-glucosidase